MLPAGTKRSWGSKETPGLRSLETNSGQMPLTRSADLTSISPCYFWLAPRSTPSKSPLSGPHWHFAFYKPLAKPFAILARAEEKGMAEGIINMQRAVLLPPPTCQLRLRSDSTSPGWWVLSWPTDLSFAGLKWRNNCQGTPAAGGWIISKGTAESEEPKQPLKLENERSCTILP